jgi:hypothetical protein
LFAHEHWGFPVSKIRVINVNLYAASESIHQVTEEALAIVATRIQAEVRQMRGLLSDPAENRAVIDRFPLTERVGLCQSCNFQRLCFPKGLTVGKWNEYEFAS